jgi:hypothetical protein
VKDAIRASLAVTSQNDFDNPSESCMRSLAKAKRKGAKHVSKLTIDSAVDHVGSATVQPLHIEEKRDTVSSPRHKGESRKELFARPSVGDAIGVYESSCTHLGRRMTRSLSDSDMHGPCHSCHCRKAGKAGFRIKCTTGVAPLDPSVRRVEIDKRSTRKLPPCPNGLPPLPPSDTHFWPATPESSPPPSPRQTHRSTNVAIPCSSYFDLKAVHDESCLITKSAAGFRQTPHVWMLVPVHLAGEVERLIFAAESMPFGDTTQCRRPVQCTRWEQLADCDAAYAGIGIDAGLGMEPPLVYSRLGMDPSSYYVA